MSYRRISEDEYLDLSKAAKGRPAKTSLCILLQFPKRETREYQQRLMGH